MVPRLSRGGWSCRLSSVSPLRVATSAWPRWRSHSLEIATGLCSIPADTSGWWTSWHSASRSAGDSDWSRPWRNKNRNLITDTLFCLTHSSRTKVGQLERQPIWPRQGHELIPPTSNNLSNVKSGKKRYGNYSAKPILSKQKVVKSESRVSQGTYLIYRSA